MLHGLYSSAIAMESTSRQHELIANNLAHAHLAGHRRVQMRHGTFDDSFHETRSQLQSRSMPGLRGTEVAIDWTPGQSKKTGVPLDIAIEGEGFFEVETVKGLRYTRNGSFRLNEKGDLVTQEGDRVQGTQGPLTLSLPASLEQVSIQADGRVLAGENLIGQIKIVSFDDLSGLIPAGGALYENSLNQRAETIDPVVRQGYLENSNTSVTRELVDMISGQRRHEAAARSLETLTKAVERHTQIHGGN